MPVTKRTRRKMTPLARTVAHKATEARSIMRFLDTLSVRVQDLERENHGLTTGLELTRNAHEGPGWVLLDLPQVQAISFALSLFQRPPGYPVPESDFSNAMNVVKLVPRFHQLEQELQPCPSQT